MIGCALSDKWAENRRSRLQSLAHCGRMAARLAVGAMLMFCGAAVPESGFSQFVQSKPPQLGMGCFAPCMLNAVQANTGSGLASTSNRWQTLTRTFR
jgi:hypothetical protein